MKLSKLIEILQQELAEHGDTTVICDCEPSDIGFYPCDYIETSKAHHLISKVQREKFELKDEDLVTFVGVDL